MCRCLKFFITTHVCSIAQGRLLLSPSPIRIRCRGPPSTRWWCSRPSPTATITVIRVFCHIRVSIAGRDFPSAGFTLTVAIHMSSHSNDEGQQVPPRTDRDTGRTEKEAFHGRPPASSTCLSNPLATTKTSWRMIRLSWL